MSRFFAGRIVQVQSIFYSPERAAWILAFESGSIATVVYSCEVRAKNIGLQVFTEEGGLQFKNWDFKLTENTIDGTLPESSDEDAFLSETKAFVKAVQSGCSDELLSDVHDATETQLVIDAARQSHASGNRVNSLISWPATPGKLRFAWGSKLMDCSGLIMAGGRSSRMRAGGCDTHKALRIVSGITLLEHNIARLCRFGIKELWLAVSNSEIELLSWVERHGPSITAAFGGTLRTICEKDQLGTIGAARCVPAHHDNVLVVNVDNLCALDLRALVQHHVRAGAALTVATHDAFFGIPFGQVIAQNGRVAAYREKPQLPVTISSGIYLLNRRAIERISPNCRTDAPELINRLIDISEPVACFHHAAPWIDVNDEDALAEAESLFGPEECRAVAHEWVPAGL